MAHGDARWLALDRKAKLAHSCMRRVG
jgi:hypothetical protein